MGLSVLVFLALCVQCSVQQFIALNARPSNNNGGNNQISFGGNGFSSKCNYLTSLGSNGQCVITTTDVDRKLKAIQDEVQRSDLRDFARHSLLQQELKKLQDIDVKLTIRVDGLQRDVTSLKAQVGSGSGSSSGAGAGAGGVNLQQWQTNTLTSIQTLNNRLNSWNNSYKTDQVSQARLDRVLQNQITQLTRDTSNLKVANSKLNQDLANVQTQNRQLTRDVVGVKQDMQKLTQQVRALVSASLGGVTPAPATFAPLTTPPAATTPAPSVGPTVAPARVLQLEADVKALQLALRQANQTNTRNYNTLSNDLTTLDFQVQNHTLQFNDVKSELRAVDIRLIKTESKANLVYNSLASLRSQLTADVAQVKADSVTLKADVKGLQAASASLLNSNINTQLGLNTVKADLASAKLDQSHVAPAIKQLQAGLSAVIQSIPGTPSTSANQLAALKTQVTTTLSGLPPVPPVLKPSAGPGGPPPTLRPGSG